MWKCSTLQAGKLVWARGDLSHAQRGERGPETEARSNETRGTGTRGIEAERRTEAPKRACATSTPDPGETTDDGCTSPILRVSVHREQRVPQSAAPAPSRPATVVPMPSPRHPPHTQPALTADGACAVLDSQPRPSSQGYQHHAAPGPVVVQNRVPPHVEDPPRPRPALP